MKKKISFMPSNKNITIKNNIKARQYGQILGIKVDSTPKSELLTQVQQKLKKKIQFYIVTPNPEIILQAQSNPDLAHSLNSADFSLPDGEGLKVANKNLNIIKGREFMIDLFKLANSKKLKLYLLGSRPIVIKKAIEKLNKEFPDIKVKGNAGPVLNKNAKTISEVDTNLQIDIVKEINFFKPDLLFVAFGAPKQEIWISKNIKKLNIIGAMVVGGALDYYSGISRPVPEWLINMKLEWLWRLVQEPKRIGRIFNAVVIFPMKVILSGEIQGKQDHAS
jgi:N-acetylglucosaminyldiphosphoundecaprenol N-acetyl-beta-D-mannosaminyltransferase